MSLAPTEEQSAILSAITGSEDNLMIDALAGTGKTSTIKMIERASKVRPILYMVFNKKNSEEAEWRVIRRGETTEAYAEACSRRMDSTTTVRTFNSLGHRIWMQACSRNIKLDPKKCHAILREIINETPKAAQGPIWDSYWDIIQGVALAKALGYVPAGKFPTARRLIDQSTFHRSLDESPDDLVSDLIDSVLIRSTTQAYQGLIDYNDQIYMPALFGGTFPRFPFIAVDEYQDLSPTNHALLDKLVKHRLIGVGDPQQNIYNFRGAKQGGMEEAKQKFSMKSFDLSVSFRCPQAIVENARWRVPHFQWLKEGGHVEALTTLAPTAIADSSAIICRNNAPLFKCALHLLASGRSVSVAGSDIGPKVIALMKKLGEPSDRRASLLSAIADWEAEKLAKKSSTAKDLAECMRVFAKFGSTLEQAVAYAEHLFAQKGSIRLLTGHKSKGLEFETVYHLDPFLLSEEEQDLNLRYVIETRSMDKYFTINSADIRW